jgi:undecaprenyl-diphosphatase
MDHPLLQAFLDWVASHPTWAGITVFLTAMGESLAIVGLFVPGAVMMFGIGALVAAGAMELTPTLIWAIAGAIAGDGVSFWLGRHYHEQLRRLWPFSRHPDLIERGIGFFHKHGGKSVLLGRFIGPIRPIIPAVAGMLDMPAPRFLAINVLSGIAWAPAYILPGMVFAASLGLAAEVASRLALLVVALLALLFLIGWLIRRAFAILHPRAGRMVAWTLAWGHDHPLVGGIGAALLDPRHPEARALGLLASLLLVATVVFLAVLWMLLGGSWPGPADLATQQILHGLRTPWADELLAPVAAVGSAPVLLTATLLGCGWLLLRGNRSAALHWLATGMVCTLLMLLLGWTLPRPSAGTTGFLPGTQSALAISVFGFLSVLMARELKESLTPYLYLGAGLLVTLLTFAQLYFGQLWLSEGLTGLALGSVWVTLVGIAYRRHPARPLAPLPLTGVIVAILVAGAVWQGAPPLAATPPPVSMDEDHWRGEGWKELPSNRIDLTGHGTDPLRLQWLGELDRIERQLRAGGWESPVPLTARNMLLWLVGDTDPASLPLLPQVHDGRHESLLLVRRQAGRPSLVRRLWDSGLRLTPDHHPLWVGSIGELDTVKLLGLVTVPRTLAIDGPLTAVLGDLPAADGWHSVVDGVLLVRTP